MSLKHRVLWSEGLFLRPQHFQQQDRYLEHFIEGRTRDLRSHSWGFSTLTLDSDQLRIGKIAIAEASGVFPDGTPFSIPDVDSPPAAIDIDQSQRDLRVYLAVPTRRDGEAEYASSADEAGLSRFVGHDISARDVGEYSHNPAELRVGKLRTRLLLASDEREDFATLGLAEVIEASADRNISLRGDYIPPMLNARSNPTLDRFLRELVGMLHQRGQALAGRVTASSQGGAGEIANFLLLQAINRIEPLTRHLAASSVLHPELLFRELVQMAGELCTFGSRGRPPEFPDYQHDELATSFQPVFNTLREALGVEIVERAVNIALKAPRYGIRAGILSDRTLLDDADFVLAVRADMPSEELRAQLPPQIKIGSVETIKRMIEGGVAGIRLSPMPAAPRQLPYHADYVYFQLDRNSEYWQDLKNSGGFAIYSASELPGMDMQFWAIRR